MPRPKKANAKGKRKQQAGSKQEPDAARKMDEGQKPSSKELECQQLSLARQWGEGITASQLKELSLYHLSDGLRNFGRELLTVRVNDDYTRGLARRVCTLASHFDPKLTKMDNRRRAKRAAGIVPPSTVEEVEEKIGPCTDLPLKDPAEIKLSSYCEEIRRLLNPLANKYGLAPSDPQHLADHLERIAGGLDDRSSASDGTKEQLWDDDATIVAQNTGQEVPNPETIPDDAMLSSAKLAEVFNVGKDALRKRLERLRRNDHTCFVENTERTQREPQFLYRVGKVRPVIEALKVSNGASSKRPPKKDTP